MRGYLGLSELTESKVKGGWLDTGDMARRDAGSRYYILGRADNMIIRSGMNIYPEEIEDALKTDARVKHVLCYGEPDPLCGAAICADVAGDISESEVREAAKLKLPNFMLPNRIRIVENLPLTASGKVKRVYEGVGRV
jgi:acyl-CoA synthetase (AMP-forming)/AMP-acid ligase II